jgi:multidrug efflux pump subunit AcrA (membrane-fusion protein)
MRALFGLGPSGGRIEDEAWLLGYAAAAWAYRMVICFWLLIGLSGRFFGLGALLAGVGALTWLGLPLARAARSLVSEPAPEADGRLSPPLRAGLVLGGLALLLLAVPVAERGRLDGVVEPTALAAIHVREGGFVEHLAQSGSRVAPGEGVILRLASPELESRQRALEAEVALARVELRGALGRDPALTRDLDENLKVLEARLERVRERRAQLVVEAPFAGVWVAPGSDAWTGAFLPAAAEPFGVVHGDGALKVRAFADASLGPRVAASLEPGDPVELRLASRPGRRLSGALEAVVPKRADDADAWPFEVRVLLDADVDAGELLAGERVVARVALGSRPLGLQWGRSLARLLLRSGGAPGS